MNRPAEKADAAGSANQEEGHIEQIFQQPEHGSLRAIMLDMEAPAVCLLFVYCARPAVCIFTGLGMLMHILNGSLSSMNRGHSLCVTMLDMEAPAVLVYCALTAVWNFTGVSRPMHVQGSEFSKQRKAGGSPLMRKLPHCPPLSC